MVGDRDHSIGNDRDHRKWGHQVKGTTAQGMTRNRQRGPQHWDGQGPPEVGTPSGEDHSMGNDGNEGTLAREGELWEGEAGGGNGKFFFLLIRRG